MKMFTTLVCIIAASAVVNAQTGTTATTKTTTKAPVAKAKKTAKKAKANTTIETVSTPVEQTTSATTETSVAPAMGTSTAATPAAAPQKTFGGYVISDTTADQTSVHGTEAVQSVTTVGASYQLTDTVKMGIGQAFESASNGMYQDKMNDRLHDGNFRAMYVEPLINKTFAGLLGTDKTKVDFRMRLNNRDALWNNVGGAAGIDRHYQLSANSSLALTPQFALTMYNEARFYQYMDNSPMGSRISLLPGAGFAVSDSLSFYQIAGYILNTKDGESMTNKRERLYLETGLNYSPAAISGLNLNLLVFQDKMIASSVGEKVSDFSLYSSNDGAVSNDAVVYEAIINYNF